MASARIHVSVACLVILLASTAAEPEDLGLGKLDGTWEGSVSYAMHQPVQASDNSGYTVRLIIKGKPTSYAVKNSKTGEWVQSPGFLDSFRFQQDEATVAGSFLRTGHDREGLWVEHQSLVVTKKDADTVLFYLLRVVNNVDLPRDHAHSTWALLLVGELRKVP